MTHSLQMDLHEAQQKGGGGGGPMGSPMEINNLKQQLQDTKKKLEAAEKQVDEKSKLCNDLENKLKVEMVLPWGTEKKTTIRGLEVFHSQFARFLFRLNCVD